MLSIEVQPARLIGLDQPLQKQAPEIIAAGYAKRGMNELDRGNIDAAQTELDLAKRYAPDLVQVKSLQESIEDAQAAQAQSGAEASFQRVRSVMLSDRVRDVAAIRQAVTQIKQQAPDFYRQAAQQLVGEIAAKNVYSATILYPQM